MARIEWRGHGLRVQHHGGIAPFTGFLHQQGQDGAAHARAAARLAHGHAADVAVWQQAARADGVAGIVIGDGVQADGVHVVEFDLGRHFLFIDENFKTDGGGVLAQGGPVAEADGVLGHGVM